MGDSDRVLKYKSAADAVQQAITSTFWTGSFIMEASIRKKDAAVICAFN